MIQEILFNPFKKLGGGKGLGIGLIILLLTAFVAGFSNCHFDGVLDAHVGAELPGWVYYYLESLMAWGITVLVFYGTGLIFSASKIRLIDILGTTAMARYPFLFMALISFALPNLHPDELPPLTPSFVFVSIVMVLISIWYIALLYHAFSVSCNLKKNKGIWTFIGAIIVAEIISKIAFHYFYFNF